MPQGFMISEEHLNGMMEASMRDVFSMMVKSSVKKMPIEQEGRLSEVINNLFGADEPLVVSNIGFGGEVFGLVYIYMKPTTAKFLAEKLLSSQKADEEVETEIVNDAVGEFSNMAIGGFKNQLSYMGYPCDLTIPSILRGQGISVETVSGCSRTLFHFKTRGQSIFAVAIIKTDN